MSGHTGAGDAHSTLLVVGAGLSGATVARCLAEEGGYHVRVQEARGHLAGSCHTERQGPQQVLVHRYGPHIFHTRLPQVWAFVCRFATMRPYLNRVKAVTDRGIFSFPINLLTLNQYFGLRLTPDEARVFLAARCTQPSGAPTSFEAQALARCGPELYESFFKHYTRKQWGVDPKTLPPELALRLPLRSTYEDAYYTDPWQALPEEGYTELVRRMLDHPRISVSLCSPVDPTQVSAYLHSFWTGPLDGFFGHRHGRLRYRTLHFEWLHVRGDFQGNPVMNWCEPHVPWTRVTEYRHFEAWRPFPEDGLSIVSREVPAEAGPTDAPFYPMRLEQDRAPLAAYQALSALSPNVTFLGRLGTYRYLDMDTCIAEALAAGREFLARRGPAAGMR